MEVKKTRSFLPRMQSEAPEFRISYCPDAYSTFCPFPGRDTGPVSPGTSIPVQAMGQAEAVVVVAVVGVVPVAIRNPCIVGVVVPTAAPQHPVRRPSIRFLPLIYETPGSAQAIPAVAQAVTEACKGRYRPHAIGKFNLGPDSGFHVPGICFEPRAIPATAAGIEQDAVGKDPKTQEGYSLIAAIHIEVLAVQAEFVLQELFDGISKGEQGFLPPMEQQHIVHVADIARYLPLLLDETIEEGEVVVGEVLTAQVADGNAPTFRHPVAVDNPIEDAQDSGVLELSPEFLSNCAVYDAIEIFADVHLDKIRVGLCVPLCLLYRSQGTLALAGGEAFEELLPFQYRPAHIHQGVLHHTFLEGGRTDLSLFGVVHLEEMIVSDPNPAG